MQKVMGNLFPSPIYILIGWGIYSALEISLKLYPATQVFSGILSTGAGVVLDISIGLVAIWLWKNAESSAKKVFAFFAIAFLSDSLSILLYNINFNILKVSHENVSTFISSTYNIPYIFSLCFDLIVWITIAPKKIRFFNKKINNLFLYIPIIFVILFTMSLFIFTFQEGHKQARSHVIMQIYDEIDTAFFLINFTLVTLCLAAAKSRNLFYIATGYLLTIGSSLILDFGFLSQSYGIGSILETGWVLGLLCVLYGLLNFKRSGAYVVPYRDWISEPDSIQAQCAFWNFFLCITSLCIFFVAGYFIAPKEVFLGTRMLQSFPPILLISAIFIVFTSNLLAKHLYNPLQRMEWLANFFMQKEQPPEESLRKANYLIADFNKLEEFLMRAFTTLKEKNTAEAEIAKLALQVSHDIRSPLAALQTLVQQVGGLDEDARVNIRYSSARINEIANNLLAKYHLYKQDNKEISSDQHKLTKEIISPILEIITAEKKAQFSSRKLSLNLEIEDNAWSLFSIINLTDFKVTLSNIVNNAVEAISNKGNISIHLLEQNNNILIRIVDDGKGIPPELLEKLGKENISYGKENGNGLGFSYAVKCIKSWNGDYAIKSQVGKGTEITIILPVVPPPSWFQERLIIYPKSNIVILDDDRSIHGIWEIRLKAHLRKNKEINVIHCFTYDDLASYFKAHYSGTDLYLVDYELTGCEKNGIDIIKEFKIQRAILVTSYFEDKRLREACNELRIKIIPKGYTPHLPIEIVTDMPELVLIDDSRELTEAWLARAKSLGKNIAVYNDPNDFCRNIDYFDHNIDIYIDSRLGEIRGEEVAKKLFEDGFKKIYLTTGYDETMFEEMYWIKKIVGKEPPF